MKMAPNGAVALVTGGSSGIGLATARLLAQRGYTVYAASRHPREERGLLPLELDVGEEASVAAALQRLAGERRRLDLIVHCAGMAVAGPAEDMPDADVHAQMEVNFFGVLRVNRLAMPLMRRCGGGRIVIVGSVGGLIPVPYHAHYCASKFALEAYGEALYNEARAFGITVTLVEPGDVSTGFTAARRRSIPGGSPYAEACERAIGVMERDELGGKPPEFVARVVVKQALAANPKPRVVVGFSYKALVLIKKLLPARLALFVVRKLYRVEGRNA